MMTADERRGQIAAIKELPVLLEGALRGLRPDQMEIPYRIGGWTIRQVVHHLADSHMNAFIRMKLLLTEEHPMLKPYDQDAWAKTADVSAVDPERSVDILRALHERWGVLLDTIPEDAWERTGLHPERGEISLARVLAIYAEHGRKHVEQITGLRKARGW
jgi:hypothetical protein